MNNDLHFSIKLFFVYFKSSSITHICSYINIVIFCLAPISYFDYHPIDMRNVGINEKNLATYLHTYSMKSYYRKKVKYTIQCLIKFRNIRKTFRGKKWKPPLQSLPCQAYRLNKGCNIRTRCTIQHLS